MTITLRKAALSDLSALQAIGIETYLETFQAHNSDENMQAYLDQAFAASQLERELANPASEFYLLYCGEEPAGYLKLNTGEAQTEPMGDDFLEVERIYVRGKFHKRGFGRRLLTKAFEMAQERHKAKLWLGVWEHNDNALAFYRKMGFVRTGTHSFFMGDDEQCDYIMIKLLA